MQQDPTIPAQPPNTTSVVTPPEEPETDVVAGEGKPRSGLRSILSTIGILLAAPLIAVALTAFVFQSYEVDGQSMHSTLQNQDRLIIWKIPRTISRITKNDYIPSRGDVVVFVRHDLFEESSGGEKQLIKRVIGLPGERVVVENGHYTVYNQERPEGFDPDANKDFSKDIITPTLPDNQTEFFVGEGEVFVSGDNRTNSLDSRSFGPIKSHDIVGRMVLRIFPVGGMKSYI